MRRIVDQLPSPDHPTSSPSRPIGPRRLLAIATGPASMVLLLAATARAGDDDLPELLPPVNMPNAAKAAKPATPPVITSTPNNNRAVMAVPGLTPTNARPATVPSVPTSQPDGADLSLDAPIEMKGVPIPNRPAPVVAPGRAAGRPIVLESAPGDDPLPMDGQPIRTTPAPRRTVSNSATTRIEPQPETAPARRGRLFGLIPGQPAPVSTPSRAPQAGRAMAEDPKEDPAIESAMKRRIERQAREAVGDRVRSVEVKVVGKNATVQARGVKFLQKRAVRKSLEGLPALSGMRSTIEVID